MLAWVSGIIGRSLMNGHTRALSVFLHTHPSDAVSIAGVRDDVCLYLIPAWGEGDTSAPFKL